MSPRVVSAVAIWVALVTLTSAGQILRDLHRRMTDAERRHFLGSEQAEYEVVYIRRQPARNDTGGISKRDVGNEEEDLVFEAFGRPYNLRLERNRHLLSEVSRIVRRLPGNESHEHQRHTGDCHFLHAGSDVTAAVSKCRDGQLRGFVSDGEMLLDIAPLTTRLKDLVHTHSKRSTTSGFPHLVRRSTTADVHSFVQGIDVRNDFLFPHEMSPDAFEDDDNFLDLGDALTANVAPVEVAEGRVPTRNGRRMIELGLYVDKAARELFLPFFDNDTNAFIDFILGFINQIQALYYLPSLGTKVDISINYLEIMEAQQLTHYGGERSQLLTSFCRYNMRMNEKAAGRNSWDMGLYLSGLNFFEMVGGRRSPVTMGLAVIAGVCTPKYSCVIGELGTTNDQGKPYPSAGFTAAYIMAHEMGHNLGMFHDSQRNTCPPNGYIMSPSRGTKGETTWSACSRETLQNMPQNCLNDLPRKSAAQNHRIFRELPGQVYDAFDQCQLLLKDHDAGLYSADDLYNVCDRVKCKSPHRIGYYYAGPALEGTFCGRERWCISGSCRAWSSPAPPIIEGGWSDWNISSCSSGCIQKATGVAISERRCDNPKPLNTEKRCPGTATNIQFCDDDRLCSYRISAQQYASQKCLEFSQIVKDIRASGEGTQVPHSESKKWSACSIYCRLNSGTWYTPRQDLNDMGVSAYFPDGTWCHNDGTIDYHCQLHECRPKVPDPPLPAAAARPVAEPLSSTTASPEPAYRLEPAGRPDAGGDRPETSGDRPVAGGDRPVGDIDGGRLDRTTYRPPAADGGGDRWHQQRPVTPTRFPPRPAPTDWPPAARPTAWPPGNGLTAPTERPEPADWLLDLSGAPSTERPQSPAWFFNLASTRPTEGPAPGQWFFPGQRSRQRPTEAGWLLGGERSRPRGRDAGWSLSTLRPPAAAGSDGRRLEESTRWPPASESSGRVRWPEEPTSTATEQRRSRAGSVRWPDAGESTRWLVRPTMPTLAPDQLQVGTGGGFLNNAVSGLWCHFLGTCD